MAVPLERERRAANVFLLAYASVATLVLSLPLSGPVRALRTCLDYLLRPIPLTGERAAERLSAAPAGLARLLQADQENARLREELKRMEWLESELRAARAENGRLLAEMGLRPLQARPLRWARVLERDTLHWHRHLTIAAGREEGIEVNAPVLGARGGRLGLLGRVSEVGSRWSKVLLLGDELSSVAAYLPPESWEGLVEGQGGPRLRMNYLPLDAQFSVGQEVRSSATSATFPPDILIGQVTRVFQQDSFLTFRSVEVAPAVEASAVQEVLVLAARRTESVP